MLVEGTLIDEEGCKCNLKEKYKRKFNNRNKKFLTSVLGENRLIDQMQN